ncbi:MAG: methyltransferase [Undibacterium sp.]|nr:methyltransferase [Opitutaceae bacterium]
MSTSTLPPPASVTVSTSGLELPSVSFFGRTLAEYAQFFALDPVALRGRAVLDVAGPASFTAEACKLGVDAVDPLYGCPVETLATHVQLDYAKMFAEMRVEPHLWRFRSFPSINAAALNLRSAARRFLNDYEAHFAHGRYVGARLPRRPFLDRAFDLVLCAHLLFIYARRFDLAWHVIACRELVRVSAGEVRIHAVCGADGRRYPELAALRAELAEAGIASEVVPVNCEFFVGSSSMQVLKTASS